MAKKRVYEIAKELGLDSKAVVEKAQSLGLPVKSHSSSLEDDDAMKLLNALKPSQPKAASSKSNKIKLSVSAIRRTNKQEKSQSKARPARNQQNGRKNDNHNSRPTKNQKPSTAARDLLKDLKTRQRVDEAKLERESAKSRRAYHEAQTTPAKPEVEPVEPKAAEKAAPSLKIETTTEVTGPKILKPSPKRFQKSDTQATRKQENRRPKTRTQNRPAAVVAAPVPEKTDRRKGNDRKSKDLDRRKSDFADHAERRHKKQKHQEQQLVKHQPTQRKERPLPETLTYEVGMNAQDLGKLLHREPAEIVKKLFMLGIMTNQNQSLDKDTIELLAADYGVNAEEKFHEDLSDLDNIYETEMEQAKQSKSLQKRPPVVTVMGHVDHGKTTLLDRLRHTHVSEKEAGGITQNIGAYQVRVDDRLVTFLDTPGHAAFSNMRARGAEVTDIVVLVVAADDGVMPQTVEAIDHAKSAGVPIIVAINKMDVPGANPQHVTEQLMNYELIPEDYGGDTIYVQISAKTGENVDQLLEMILLQADVMELQADPTLKAIGTVIEARLSRGRGPVADVLIQQGTLNVGDPVVVGNTFGRIRTMTNDKGRQVKKATPSMPVEITGLSNVPVSADKLVEFADEKTARSVGETRAQQSLLKQREQVQHVTLDNLFDTMKRENMKSVDIVLKADVQGSVEALAQSLQKIEVEGVRVNIIHSGVGAINESDVTLAGASNAFIIGFNVRPTATARSQADGEGVDIRLYSIIYKAIDDVESAMKGMLEPTFEEKVTGNLTVRETWKVSKVGTIAGAFVNTGHVTRDSGIRLIRDGVVIYDGQVGSLKRFKDDVKEVKAGYDCGLTIEGYNDLRENDELEVYEMQEVKPQ